VTKEELQEDNYFGIYEDDEGDESVDEIYDHEYE